MTSSPLTRHGIGRLFVVGAALLCGRLAIQAERTLDTDSLRFFESSIRPILSEHCFECHSNDSKRVKGGLYLDTREAWMRGGDSGPVIVPGDPDESALYEAVLYQTEDFQMPPDYRLADDEIAAIRQWITSGAPDPRSEAQQDVKPVAARDHWAFQPVEEPTIPEPEESDWAKSDVDRLLLSRIESKDLRRAEDADRYTLLRRLTFDLTGLPPTLSEIHAFVNDPSSDDDAIETVVDRLLADPAFGERWARHWLDTVRFAESTGMTRNYPYPTAWRYRDYVINAFNADKPFKEFVTEQLAGDLITAESAEDAVENIVATGFLAIGPLNLNEGNRRRFEMEVVDEQIDVTTRALMGLTVSCARCHDHKFDPIPNEDYYSLAGIFLSSELKAGYANRQGGNDYFKPDLLLPTSTIEPKTKPDREIDATIAKGEPVKSLSELEKLNSEVEATEAALEQLTRFEKVLKKGAAARQRYIARLGQSIARTPLGGRLDLGQITADELAAKKKSLERKLNNLQSKHRNESFRTNIRSYAMGVQDADKMVECRVHIQGDIRRLGDRMPRGFVAALSDESTILPPENESGRLELANWITSPENPLTARVFVNRVWARVTGEPIVETVDNFGATGSKPTNPELLDHLATRFLAHDGRLKPFLKELVTSRFYRMRSDHDKGNHAIDPDNQTLWRMNSRRLEVEAIRDALLRVGGRLKSSGPEDPLIVSTDQQSFRQATRDVDAFLLEPYRTIYLPVLRDLVPTMLTNFDFPDPSQIRGQREITTVPTQALFMMNSPLVAREAKNAGTRLAESVGVNHRTRVRRAYLETIGRQPTAIEMRNAFSYFSQSQEGWERLYHALFASGEFRYLL